MPERPPKCWWNPILQKIEREYPTRSEQDQKRIAGGIWAKYKKSTKEKITADCERKKRKHRKAKR